MRQLFASGRIVDIILVFMVVEALLLVIYRRVFVRGLTFADIASVLVPGLFLLLALREALLGSHWSIIALWLLMALIAHLADLWRRQRGAAHDS